MTRPTHVCYVVHMLQINLELGLGKMYQQFQSPLSKFNVTFQIEIL